MLLELILSNLCSLGNIKEKVTFDPSNQQTVKLQLRSLLLMNVRSLKTRKLIRDLRSESILIFKKIQFLTGAVGGIT